MALVATATGWASDEIAAHCLATLPGAEQRRILCAVLADPHVPADAQSAVRETALALMASEFTPAPNRPARRDVLGATRPRGV